MKKKLTKQYLQDKRESLEEENLIKDSKTITPDDLKAFEYWYNYDAASTIGFLVRRLKLIKSIIEGAESVTVEENPIILLSTLPQLKEWITNRFEEFITKKVFDEL